MVQESCHTASHGLELDSHHFFDDLVVEEDDFEDLLLPPLLLEEFELSVLLDAAVIVSPKTGFAF